MAYNFIDKTIDTIQDGIDTVSDKYNSHIKEKAIEAVDKRILEKGIDIDQINDEDYEAMVSDLSKDIKEEYSSNTTKGLLAVIGLDMLLGW